MNALYAETILDSLSAHIAIIDETGMIIETNRAWREFARANDIDVRPDMVNINYLEICDAADDSHSRTGPEVANGIRRVIRRELDEFVMDYPCHSPGRQRWFYMRAIRASGSDPLRVVISHENITDLKLAEQKIKQREQELELKSAHLEEANAALRAILRQRDQDIKEMEYIFFNNLKFTVFPYIDRLKDMIPQGSGTELIRLVESELNQIASPFLRRLSAVEEVLTPQEMKIASLIKEDKSSKQIADLLNLSLTTVNFHRRNLRDKLGLKNRGTNLSIFLKTLTQ